MGSIKPTEDLRGFLIPLPMNEDNLWAGQATYGQRYARAGTPTSQADGYALGIESQGDQTNNVTIFTQRGGNPEEATFLWKETAGGTYKGKNENNALQFWEFVISATGGNYYKPLDAFTAKDGRTYVAVKVYNGASYYIKIYMRNPSTNLWEVSELVSTNLASIGDKYYAGICQLEDGTILVAHWNPSDNGTYVQVKTWRSTDKGETFTVISSEALPARLNTDGVFGAGNTGYDVERIRIRALNGQVLMVCSVIAHNTSLSKTDLIAQYGSVSDGTSFELVEISAGNFGYFRPDLIINDCLLYTSDAADDSLV